jgi:hypothetical protein
MKKGKTMSAKRPKTHVLMLWDKSGSMQATRQTALQAFNEQCQKFKEIAQDQDILLYFLTFSHDVFEHLWGVPADQLTEATEEDYVCNGGTAMRDAIGYGVKKLLDTTDTEEENAAYLVITISDGETRDDQHYSAAQIRELRAACEATKKWTFSFMGCSEESMYKLSHDLGVSASNMASWSTKNAKVAEAGLKNANSRSYKYFDDRLKGVTTSCTYMNDTQGLVAKFDEEEIDNVPQAPVSNPVRKGKINVGDLLNHGMRTPKPPLGDVSIDYNDANPAWVMNQNALRSFVDPPTNVGSTIADFRNKPNQYTCKPVNNSGRWTGTQKVCWNKK